MEKSTKINNLLKIISIRHYFFGAPVYMNIDTHSLGYHMCVIETEKLNSTS